LRREGRLIRLNLWSYPRAFFCTGPTGAIGTRLSLRPPIAEGESKMQDSDVFRREIAKLYLNDVV